MTAMLAERVSPIHISFPLLARPGLTVDAWRESPPEATGNVLTIEVTNVIGTPIEVSEGSVGYMHTFLPAELLLGKGAAGFTLHDLAGDAPPTRVVGGGSVRWAADLDQVKDLLMNEQLRSSPRLRRTYDDLSRSGYIPLDRFYTDLMDIEPETDGAPRGRLAIKAQDVGRQLTHRRLAVMVRYGRGGLYKAQVRWRPPRDDLAEDRRRPSTR